ncbi:CvpA family protein [Coralloluteibacterium thermophilus]|uniref:CvpA family protein n=1 Tax=Coralloluteibacterium thermophilum TaxID=2707049 RepID=A0ABV9NN38_9GAMM
MSLNWADLVLIGILALSTLIGLVRGFLVEALSLAIWAAAFWLAFTYGHAATALFAGVEPPSARLVLGYATVFVGAILVGGLLTWLLSRLIRVSGLSGTDRLLGMLFGLLRGAALGCVLVLVLGFTALPQDPWWAESRLLPQFERGAAWMATWLPDWAAASIDFRPEPAPPAPAPPGTADAVPGPDVPEV